VKPVFALVGRPNTGKSTLFNRLTRSRDALVGDTPGLTRDRLVGTGEFDGNSFWVVDTGGYVEGSDTLQQLTNAQVATALAQADAVVLMTDARAGAVPADRELARWLRTRHARVHVAVNKAEGTDPALAEAEFQGLGHQPPVAISAQRGSGVRVLLEQLLSGVKASGSDAELADTPRVAVCGRPNVGKSSLINALLGEERVLVSGEPGTTRDSVRIPFVWKKQPWVLIDTAGVRRHAKIRVETELLAVMATMRATESANVVILVVDASAGVNEQDARLAGLVTDSGRSMLLVVNKCDAVSGGELKSVRAELRRRLSFLDGVEQLFVSAKTGAGLGGIMPAVAQAYRSAMKILPTAEVNRAVQKAVQAQPPPRVGLHAIKIKYAHQGGKNPPMVVLHGNLVTRMPKTYQRYLANNLRRQFALHGTPVRIVLRGGRNPFAGERADA
jgi:GTP-binding protein